MCLVCFDLFQCPSRTLPVRTSCVLRHPFEGLDGWLTNDDQRSRGLLTLFLPPSIQCGHQRLDSRLANPAQCTNSAGSGVRKRRIQFGDKLIDGWLTNLRKQGDVEVLDPSLETPQAPSGAGLSTPLQMQGEKGGA